MAHAPAPEDLALIDWLARFGGELRAFLRRRLKCPQTAEELAQETLLRLYTSRRAYPLAHLRARALRIAANLAVDHQRKKQVRARHELATPSWEIAADGAPDPERIVGAKQSVQQLVHALHELSPDCRAVLIWSRMHGLTHRQIAARLGISESMVAKHLDRALRHCRSRVDPT